MSYFATGAALTSALNALPSSLSGTYKAFDAFYYAAQYMTNYSGTLTPVEHFVQIGAARGYQPNADFNPTFYQSKYADLAGLDAADLLFHYVKFGLNEGRAGNATLAAYNWADYLTAYPAVATYVNANLASFGGSATNGAIAHYVKFGAQQGFTLPNVVAQTFTLTTGVDALTGTAGNDSFVANPGALNAATFTSFDSIDGGAGTSDAFNIVSIGAFTIPATASVKNIETATITGDNTVTADVSGWTGLTTVKSSSVGGATLTAAATTAVTATDAALAAALVSVTGGSSATITAAGLAGATHAVAATGVTGATTVTVAAKGDAAANVAIGDVLVTAGTSASVTQALTGSTNVAKTLTGAQVTVTGTATTTTVSSKSTASAAATATNGAIAANTVVVNDANANSATKAGTIATVSVDGYKTGSSVSSNALSSLTLANSDAAATFTVVANNATVVAAPTALNLTLNNAAGTVDLENGANALNKVYKTVNITATGKASSVAVTSTLATAITVAGDQKLTLTGANAAVTAFTSTNTAGVTATLNAGSTGVFGDGADVVTVGATATKAVTLGAGNDTAVVSTLGTGGSVDGGTGTNTLSMVAADAATASGSNAFAGKVTNFQKLVLTGATNETVDASVLGAYHDVTTSGGNGLTINGLASGDTLNLTAAGTAYTVGLTNALAGTNDVLNVTTKAAASTSFGAVTAANVETVNVTTTDSSTTPNGSVVDTLSIAGNTAKTIAVAGTAATALTAASTALTSLDASGLVVAGAGAASTGLTWASGATAAALTIKGSANGGDVIDASLAGAAVTITETAGVNNIKGSGTIASTLTGGTGADTILGGTGRDVIVGGGGADVITGGAGADNITVSGITAKIVQAIGASGANSSTTIQTAELTSTFDVIKGLVAGDKIDLGNTNIATAQLTLAGANLASGGDNVAVFASGTYDAAAGTFTYAANGADTALTYDSTTAVATITAETIILVGYHAASTTAATAGLITLA